MVGIRNRALTRSIEAVYQSGASATLSDTQLLDRIKTGTNDLSQIAFEVIVARHGGMVLKICSQALNDPHNVEDAFQATFLVLARRAGSIRCGESLASWLFGVARRICVRVRADAHRRRIHERRAAERMAQVMPIDSGHDYEAIHEEIARLPDRYRLPIILCYIQGLTYEVAADRLDCPVGTLSVRLSRARELLRSRLSRRGLTASACLLTFKSAAMASTAVPADVAMETIRASLQFMGFRPAIGGEVPPNAVSLAKGVLEAMYTATRMKMVVLGFGMVLVAGLGGLAWSDMGGGESPRDDVKPTPASKITLPLAEDLAKLQGVWIKIDPGRDNKDLVSLSWEIDGATIITRTTRFDGLQSESRSEIRIDEQIVPRGIDFVRKSTPVSRLGVKGKEQEVVERIIYKIEGDTLTVCGRQGFNQPRPERFPDVGGDKSLEVSIFRRSKPPGSAAVPKTPIAAPRGDLAKLQGTWTAGRLGPRQDMKAEVVIEGDAMTVSIVAPSSSTSRTMKIIMLNEEARPQSLDLELSGSKPARLLGIYQLHGDTLTLRFGTPDGTRPTELKAEGPDSFSLLALKRRPMR